MKPSIDYFKWKGWRALNGAFHGISEASALEKLRLLIGVLSQYEPLGVASVISNDLHREIFQQNPDTIMRQPYFLSFHSVVVQLAEHAAVRYGHHHPDFLRGAAAALS